MSETQVVEAVEVVEITPGDLWWRSSQIVDVAYEKRTIDVIVMPYEETALVEHEGRMVEEVISRGAFDGVQRRARRVKAYRGHPPRDDLEGRGAQLIGRADSLYPDREAGLVARLKIAGPGFPLGEETLKLADVGALDASAGFRPFPDGGERWETRSRRRVLRAFLGHIALVPEPAYEGANVLAVRSRESPATQSATPNLDQYREQVLADRLAALVASDPALQDR